MGSLKWCYKFLYNVFKCMDKAFRVNYSDQQQVMEAATYLPSHASEGPVGSDDGIGKRE